MPSQEHVRPQHRDEEPADAPETPPAPPAGAATKEGLGDDIDSVIDLLLGEVLPALDAEEGAA